MSVSRYFVPLHRGCHISHPLFMAKVLRTLAPVDSMSGMVGKRDETVSNKAFIINLKKVGNVKNGGAPFMYFSLRQNDRKTKPSTAELSNRYKFGAVSKAVAARLINPEYIEIDQSEFNKQDRYKTMQTYLFAKLYQEYDNE